MYPDQSLIGFCGVMSIFSSMRYCLGPASAHANLWYALAFMPFGLFFDFMDGKVARWRKKSSLMGQELDSLADLVCYSQSTRGRYLTCILSGFFWTFSCCSGICNWSPYTRRPPLPDFLRPLRLDSSCSLQHHGCQCPQGCNWEEPVL